MHFRRLRWLGVWLPLLFVIAVQLFEDFYLEPIFGRWKGYLIIFAAIGIGAVIFTLTVFRVIDKAEAFLRQQNQDLADLNEISQIVSGDLELDRVLTRTLSKVMAATQSRVGQIYLLDESGCNLLCKICEGPATVTSASASAQPGQVPVGTGIFGVVAATGQAIMVQDSDDLSVAFPQAAESRQIGPLISVPLRAKDKVVGVMNVADRAKAYTSAELSLLTAIGNQIGVAIENAKLHTQVEQQARYLSTLIECSGNAIITANAVGEIQSWNQAAEQIYGWRKDEAIGQILPMVPKHLLDQAYSLTNRLLNNRKTIHNFETVRMRKGGELIPVMVTVSPLQDGSGTISGLLGVSTDMREKKRLEHELFQQQHALAAVKERERLARELHDGLGQILGYINTQSQAARELLAAGLIEESDAHLARLVEVAQESYTDVREHILGLHAAELLEEGLVSALTEYVKRLNQSNALQVSLNIDEKMSCVTLGPNVEAQLMRIIQEALANVRKHAQTDRALVQFIATDNRIRVVIEDHGCGFDSRQLLARTGRRFGLEIMRDRSTEIGANIDIQSRPGEGTKVTIQVPCQAKEEYDEAITNIAGR
ncbi:MAG: PAS domain S-box protein [Chloroflexi bacterium]|nr:PAS domain S-box protein [Chloroflexota bacterium]